MPRKYVRKTNRAFADPKDMLECARLIIKDRKSARSVAMEHGLNYRSLLRYCSRPNIHELLNGECKDADFRKRSQIFSESEEQTMIDSLLKRYKTPCDLLQKTIRQFAYEFAKTKVKRIPPSWVNNKQAGPDWFFYFMKRHTDFASQRNFLLRRDGALKSDNSAKSCYEIEYMDLPFPVMDPLEDAFDESQNGETDEKNEDLNFSPESLVVVKSEFDDSFLSEELESSETSNPSEKSTVSPFKVSTIISENDLNEKDESTENDLHYVKLPNSWSITALPRENDYRFCLSFIVTTLKDNVICPVIEKCILIDAKRQLFFKARNVNLDNDKLKLPSTLDDLTKLPRILSNFQNLHTCKGLNNMESLLLQELPVMKDCLQTWRHTQCSLLLLKNERCEFCSQLFLTIQEKIAKVMDPKFFS